MGTQYQNVAVGDLVVIEQESTSGSNLIIRNATLLTATAECHGPIRELVLLATENIEADASIGGGCWGGSPDDQ